MAKPNMQSLRRRLLRDAPNEISEEIVGEAWEPNYTGGQHIRWLHPSGAIAFTSATPSEWREWRNNITMFRRALQGRARRVGGPR